MNEIRPLFQTICLNLPSDKGFRQSVESYYPPKRPGSARKETVLP